MTIKLKTLLGTCILLLGCTNVSKNVSKDNTKLLTFIKILSTEYSYQAEESGHDYWRSPRETSILKTGDCEDFAIFTSDSLHNLGYVNKMFAVFEENSDNHVITIAKVSDDIYVVFSNTEAVFYTGGSYIDILEQVIKQRSFKDWKVVCIFKPENYGSPLFGARDKVAFGEVLLYKEEK